MPIDALYEAIRNAPNQRLWQAAQQREAASHQAAIDEAVRREQEAQRVEAEAQRAQQLWNGYDYNAEAERRAQVGGYAPAPEAFRIPTEFAPRTEYDPQEQARRVSAAWQPSGGIEVSGNNRAAYIPGTQIEYGTERGDAYLALAAQRDSVDKAAEPFNPFKAMTAAGDARGALQVGAPAAKTYNALNDASRAIEAEQGRINEFLNDEEYRADKAAAAAAIAAQQRRENLDPTEAAWQLDQLKAQRDALKAQISGGKSTVALLYTGTTDEAARNDEIQNARQEQLARLDAAIRALEGDVTARQNETRYANIMRLPDFEQNSQYVPHERRAGTGFNDPSGEGLYRETELQYEMVNGNQQAVNQYNRITNNGGKFDGLAYMTDEERRIYNYLYDRDMQSEDSFARDDPETHGESGKYINEILPTLNARMRAALEADIRAEAKAHPFAMSVASVLTSPLKAASYASQLGDFAATGKIDPNASGSAYSYLDNAVRSTVSREIERKWGKTNSFAYNTGMSFADSLYQMLLTGGPAGEGAMLVLMGMESAADTVIAAKERGLTDAQAFALGTATGAIEALTEKIGFDNLYNVALRGDTAALKALLSQALAEGSEEFAGSVLDNLADMIIAGTDSEHYRRVRALVASGMSETEAIRKAWAEDFGEAGMEALSGALSGMLMSGGGRAIMSAFNAAPQIVQNIRDTREQNRVDEMVRMANEEAAQRYAGRTAPQTAPTTQETATNPPVSPQNAPQTTNDTAEPTRTETPIQNAENGGVLWTHPSDNSGWKEQYNGDNPTYDALRLVDPEMFEAFLAEGVEGNTNAPIIDAYVSAYNDVRQGTISPMAAATLLSDAYNEGGAAALAALYNPSTGNLVSPALETAKQIDARHDAPAQGNTEQTLGNTVGAAQTGYNYANMPREQKVSRQYYTTDRFTDEKGVATGNSRYAYRQAFTYETRSREESMQRAKEMLYYMLDGKEVWAGDVDPQAVTDIMQDLRSFPAWNDVMTDAAKLIEDRLVAESVRARASGTKAEAAAARKALNDWQSIVQDRIRAGARGMSVLNDWSGVGNENGLRTELGAVEAVKQNDNLTDEQKTALIDEIEGFMDEARGAETSGDLVDLILRIGRRRGTVTTNAMAKIVQDNLNLLDAEQLRQAAYSSASMLAFDRTPVGALQKAKTIQVLNMLSNPKTMFTNVTSNTGFYLLDKLAMRGSALIDAILEKATDTRSVAWEDAVTKDMANEIRLAAAKSVAEIALDIDMGGEGKYAPTGTRSFKADGNFVDKVVSTWERNNSFALVTPDEIAKAATRASTGRSINRLQEQGRIRSENENYAQDYQDDMAKYRTFQNERILSGLTRGLHDVLNLVSYSTIEQMRDGVGWKNLKPAQFGLGDFVAPFSKIGGNLVGVALDYSPAKLLTGIGQLIELGYREIRAELSGDASYRVTAEQQRRVVQNLGRGFTGTLLTLALMGLAASGITRRAKDDDKSVTALNKAQGQYVTQINMSALWRLVKGGSAEWQEGDKLFDLSRFEPFNFFVDLALMLNDNTEGADDFVSYVGGAGQAMLESFGNNVSDMPVFQSVGNFLESTNYGDKWYEAALKSLGRTGVSSVTPNVIAAFAKGIDDKQRNLYTRDVDEDTLIGAIKSAAGESFDYLKSRIPFLRETLPTKRTTTGAEQENPGDLGLRLFNAMALPLGVNEYSSTAASQELERLRGATGSASFYPKTRQPSKLEHTEKGEKTVRELNYEERQAFQETYSAAYWETVNALVGTAEYKRLSDEDKAKALSKCENWAYQNAKIDYLGRSAAEAWVREAPKNASQRARYILGKALSK